MEKTSLDITQDLINKLKELMPQAFNLDNPNKIDFEKLKTILSDYTIENERYNLSWAGKSQAYKILQNSISKTLIPDLEKSIDFENAQNILIEGENLEVLKILQKSYYGKVKMIYIDPPYNTGNDSFIYPDKFKENEEEYLQRVGDKDEEGKLTKSGYFRKNTKENGHYHSNWLNMMLPRLFLARNLLRDDGVIFISIDDNEQANLKLLCDEIFGEENFVAQISWNGKGGGADNKFLMVSHEYILLYAKNKINFTVGEDIKYGEIFSKYDNIKNRYYKTQLARKWRANSRREDRPNLYYAVNLNGEEIYPILPNGEAGCWRWKKEKMLYEIEQGKIEILKEKDKTILYEKIFQPLDGEFNTKKISTFWSDLGNTAQGTKELIDLFSNKIFSYPKPISLINKILTISNTKQNDIILDFFAGSGTTPQAVMELNEEDAGNRKYICVQLDEEIDEKSEAFKAGYKTIADITYARITKVIEKIQQQRLEKPNNETQKQNLGFRKYTLSESNFKEWQDDIDNVEDLAQQIQMLSMQYHNSSSNNILWELILKNGISLDTKIQNIIVDESIIYYTQNLAFVLEKYSQNIQQTLLDLKPQKIIALDSIFSDDNVKTNASLKFKDANIEFETI